MKAEPPSPTTPKRSKPYTKPAATKSDDESKPSNEGHQRSLGSPSPKSSKAQSKAWTGEEYRIIFHYVVKHGAPGSEKGWEGVVPGRSGAQTRGAWRNRLSPRIDRIFDSTGKEE